MDDDQAPIEETPAAVEETVVDEQPSVNWEKRYNDLRPEFDRTSQEAAQYKQLVEALSSEDQHTRNAALEQLGYEAVETEDDEDDYVDPTQRELAEIRSMLSAQEQREAAAESQRQQAQQERVIEEATQRVEQQLDGLNVSPESRDWILTRAINLPPTTEGLPDIEAAHAQFAALIAAEKKSWAGTKQGAHVSPVGTSGTSVPDLDDPVQRQRWMVEQLHARSG